MLFFRMAAGYPANIFLTVCMHSRSSSYQRNKSVRHYHLKYTLFEFFGKKKTKISFVRSITGTGSLSGLNVRLNYATKQAPVGKS